MAADRGRPYAERSSAAQLCSPGIAQRHRQSRHCGVASATALCTAWPLLVGLPGGLHHRPRGVHADFTPWTSGLGPTMLEALQPELTTRWIEVERLRENEHRRLPADAKSWSVARASPDCLPGRGRKGQVVLILLAFYCERRSNFLEITGQRRDVGRRYDERRVKHGRANCHLSRALWRSSRQFPQLQSWERRAQSVGYFDEGYRAAQLWKADWDLYQGDALHERAAVDRAAARPDCARRERHPRTKRGRP